MHNPEYNDVEDRIKFNFHNVCPHCNTTIRPIIQSIAGNETNSDYCFLTLSCTACEKYYYETFKFTYSYESSFGRSRAIFDSCATYPMPSPQIDLPDGIKLYYPEFTRIYVQSAVAENLQLFEICGMGYRKALESLIKQYAVELFPDEKSKIDSELLLPTINRFASDDIKALAIASAWLGNDHAHLIAKYPDCDLEQLKSFIKVLCQFILSNKEVEKAKSLIASRKK